MTLARRLRRDDRGMVTAETAVVLPVLVLLTLAAVAAVTVALAKVRCADAAQLAARAIARGDSGNAVRLAHGAAGSAVRISTSTSVADTVVTARLPWRPVSWLGTVTIVETATVATEPTTAP
ncbi:MAG TPA: TadE family type IV pilus minor pilin [Jatrophihabitans sp.]|nr:TadE family type IV pilus minor pilin [Jatrophihabitans sp.]